MSEPNRIAQRLRTVVPSVRHWTLFDDRIDYRSDAYALTTAQGTVLIDPLPLVESGLARFDDVIAICITIQSHQRSAWRYRKRFGVPVHAPMGAEGLEAAPDAWYRHGDSLPGGLRAIHAPGPCDASYVLVHERRREGSVMFLGDVLTRSRNGSWAFVPGEYMDEPARARESVRSLLRLHVDALCPGHGAPLATGGRDALREAWDRDRRSGGATLRAP